MSGLKGRIHPLLCAGISDRPRRLPVPLAGSQRARKSSSRQRGPHSPQFIAHFGLDRTRHTASVGSGTTRNAMADPQTYSEGRSTQARDARTPGHTSATSFVPKTSQLVPAGTCLSPLLLPCSSLALSGGCQVVPDVPLRPEPHRAPLLQAWRRRRPDDDAQHVNLCPQHTNTRDITLET